MRSVSHTGSSIEPFPSWISDVVCLQFRSSVPHVLVRFVGNERVTCAILSKVAIKISHVAVNCETLSSIGKMRCLNQHWNCPSNIVRKWYLFIWSTERCRCFCLEKPICVCVWEHRYRFGRVEIYRVKRRRTVDEWWLSICRRRPWIQ